MLQFPLFTIVSLQFPKKLEAFARFHVKDNDSDPGETHSVPLTQMGWVAKSHMTQVLSADSEELLVGAWQGGEGPVHSPQLGWMQVLVFQCWPCRPGPGGSAGGTRSTRWGWPLSCHSSDACSGHPTL